MATGKTAAVEGRSLIFLASALVPVHAAHMDSEPFLESCSLANEQEAQRAYYLPSPAEITVMKRQIRAEKEANEALEGGPPYLKMHSQTKVFRTDYSQGRITREH